MHPSSPALSRARAFHRVVESVPSMGQGARAVVHDLALPSRRLSVFVYTTYEEGNCVATASLEAITALLTAGNHRRCTCDTNRSGNVPIRGSMAASRYMFHAFAWIARDIHITSMGEHDLPAIQISNTAASRKSSTFFSSPWTPKCRPSEFICTTCGGCR